MDESTALPRTALVTGGSRGIGYELAAGFAAAGYDLVLVARRAPELGAAASTLRDRHGVEVRVLAADLSAPGAARRVREFTDSQGLTIDVVVNNAGLLTNGPFHSADLGSQQAMLAVNVNALTELTHLYLSDMIDRGSGRILNVASTASWVGIPEQSVYSASKAYVLAFSLALSDEMAARKTGVSVTAVCPNYTDTLMLDNPDQGGVLPIPRFMVLDPKAVARAGVNGCLAGKPLVIPGASNVLGMYGLQVLPRRLATSVFGRLYRHGLAGSAGSRH